jgi:hypothetical protein
MKMDERNTNNTKSPMLYSYFKKSAEILLAEYERSKGQRSTTNIGINREIFCSKFLSRVLPPRLKVRNGEIWDSQGNRTGQLDIIIIRDDAPALTFGEADVYLAEGVFGVIEVKSNLDRTKLEEARNGLAKVSNLKINVGATISSGATINRPLRIIFAYEGASWKTLLDEINKKGCPDLFDLVCILNRGILIKKGSLLNWEGEQEFMAINNKAASLGFLYFYLISYGSSFLGRSLILNPYFEPLNRWRG